MLGTLKSYARRLKTRKIISEFRKSEDVATKAIADALNASMSPVNSTASSWHHKIEKIRTEMYDSQDTLDAWARPWLEKSEELSKRLGITTDSMAEGMTISQAVRASKSMNWCLALFELTYQLRPTIVIELGTNVGVSGLYIASALKEIGAGKLITLEGSPSKAVLAQQNFDRMGLTDQVEIVVGDFFDTLEQVLSTHAENIQLGFIDGFHEGAATIQFHKLFLKSMDSGVIVYDDIYWSKGMREAWSKIRQDRQVNNSAEGESVGFCSIASAHPETA